ncbi:hypothetical protein D3C81_2041420 [compost metagenome]
MRPDTSTASSTPTRPMMIRAPNTGGAAAVAGLAAAMGTAADRDVMNTHSGGKNTGAS